MPSDLVKEPSAEGGEGRQKGVGNGIWQLVEELR